MPGSPSILTFEIGGTETRVGIFQDDHVTALDSVATPNTSRWGAADLRPMTEALATLTASASGRVTGYEAVGVSITGMMRMVDSPGARNYGPFKDASLILSSPNIAGLENVDLFALAGAVGWTKPVHFENDANAVLRSATEFSDALCINMGTGFAASVKENGLVKRSPPFWSCYEIGHGFRWTFPDALTRKCACGATGCLEAVIGSRALRERYGVRPENATPDIYGRMRDDLVRYGAPAILDTAKRFRKRQILLSGRSILGFNADGEILERIESEMQAADPSADFELHVLEMPDTSGMLGVALSVLDYDIV